MNIPDTPEQLFEQLGDETIRELFPNFDSLSSTQRKIVQVFHTELTKGQLNDETFMETISLSTHLWGYFNRAACLQLLDLVESNRDEVSIECVNSHTAAARVNQFIDACLNLYDAVPECILHKGGGSTYHFSAHSAP
jgi:hypothetical protein